MNEFIEKLIKLLKDEERDYRRRWKYKGENEEDWQCMKAMQKAIGIVEQLAEEHNNDFCEWEADDKEIDVYYTKCGQAHIFIDGNPEENNHVFCPYCGKKIKVVDAPYKKGE